MLDCRPTPASPCTSAPPSGLYCTAMLHVSEFASAKP